MNQKQISNIPVINRSNGSETVSKQSQVRKPMMRRPPNPRREDLVESTNASGGKIIGSGGVRVNTIGSKVILGQH